MTLTGSAIQQCGTATDTYSRYLGQASVPELTWANLPLPVVPTGRDDRAADSGACRCDVCRDLGEKLESHEAVPRLRAPWWLERAALVQHQEQQGLSRLRASGGHEWAALVRDALIAQGRERGPHLGPPSGAPCSSLALRGGGGVVSAGAGGGSWGAGCLREHLEGLCPRVRGPRVGQEG